MPRPPRAKIPRSQEWGQSRLLQQVAGTAGDFAGRSGLQAAGWGHPALRVLHRERVRQGRRILTLKNLSDFFEKNA